MSKRIWQMFEWNGFFCGKKVIEKGWQQQHQRGEYYGTFMHIKNGYSNDVRTIEMVRRIPWFLSLVKSMQPIEWNKPCRLIQIEEEEQQQKA